MCSNVVIEFGAIFAAHPVRRVDFMNSPHVVLAQRFGNVLLTDPAIEFSFIDAVCVSVADQAHVRRLIRSQCTNIDASHPCWGNGAWLTVSQIAMQRKAPRSLSQTRYGHVSM